MPEYTISELEELTEKMSGEMKRTWEDFIAQMKEAGDTSIALTEVSKEMGNALLEAAKAGTAMGDALLIALTKAGAGFNILGGLIDNNRDKAVGMGVAAAVAFERLFLDVLPSGTDAFGSMAEAGVSAGSTINKSFETIKKPLTALISTLPMVGKRAGDIATGFGRIAQSVDAVISMERNIVRLAAASGDMESVMGRNAGTFIDLTTQATSYVRTIGDASLATGISTEAVSKYAEALGTAVPGALRRTDIAVGGTIGSTSELTAGLKIASAFQIDYNQVAEDTKLAYRELGTEGQGALEMIAGMAMAAKESGLPMDTMRTYVLETARSFKMFGDNAQGAISILSGMRGALIDSGMGPEAIRDLVGGMTAGIKDMDIAHKAFISAQTGGRGGLAGAFEMDWLLRQGRTEEVMSRTMNAMQRQFGGPIVTLEEVQQTPALAGQLLKQVAFLTDVAGVAKDQASAYRILEGMKRGAPEAMLEARETPEDRLETAVQLGHELQKQGNTSLKQIETHTKVASMTGQILAKKEFGGLIGLGEGEVGERMMGAMRRTPVRTGEGITPGPTTPEAMLRDYTEAAGAMSRKLVEGEGGEGGVRGFLKKMTGAATEMAIRGGATLTPAGKVVAPGATPGEPPGPEAVGETAAMAARTAGGAAMSWFDAFRQAGGGIPPEGERGRPPPGSAEALLAAAMPVPRTPGEEAAPMFELPPLEGNVDFNITLSTEAMEKIADKQIQARISKGNIAGPTGSEMD
jgi:hypothetical protein